MTRNTKVAIGSIAALVGLSGCISTESEVLDAAEGCDEYKSGDLGSLDLDPSAKSFIEASIDLKGSTDRISEDVLTACKGIANDLGGENSWKDEEGLSAKISNDRGTGACDVATDLINEELTSAAEVNANVRVAVAEGECPIDFQAQKECDKKCAANTECSPGSVDTRCEPGKIIASCDGSCQREAYCVGHAELSANCTGKCEAKCTGMCTGTC